MIYPFIKWIFFKFDPELVHICVLKLLKACQNTAWISILIRYVCDYKHVSLESNIFGCEFKNPIGLAAGFDKNCESIQIFSALGFGFIEGGSISFLPNQGHASPRLFRLEKDKSLLNYMGLNNHGAKHVLKHLQSHTFDTPVGVNIARSEKAISIKQDFVLAFEQIYSVADYIVLNVSCPNVSDASEIAIHCDAIVSSVQKKNRDLSSSTLKPVFIKVSSADSLDRLDQIACIGIKYGLTGIVVSNTISVQQFKHLKNKYHRGGVSGKLIQKYACDTLSYLYQKYGKQLLFIGVGGIHSAESAYQRICHGASLIQIYTAYVYNGPLYVKKINKQLQYYLRRDGLNTIQDAVGSAFQK